jgi:ArsR family transcriptional regulator
MIEGDEVSRLLDVLGNRNRRRIIGLLREKPCFVTEISERLEISPKAVVEHLQYMERENILLWRVDERRRKYYYLSRKINVRIEVEEKGPKETDMAEAATAFYRSVRLLRNLFGSRNYYLGSLEYIEHDIDAAIRDFVSSSKDILECETEITLVTALCSSDLSMGEIAEITGISQDDLEKSLGRLVKAGIVSRNGQLYKVRDKNGT